MIAPLAMLCVSHLPLLAADDPQSPVKSVQAAPDDIIPDGQENNRLEEADEVTFLVPKIIAMTWQEDVRQTSRFSDRLTVRRFVTQRTNLNLVRLSSFSMLIRDFRHLAWAQKSPVNCPIAKSHAVVRMFISLRANGPQNAGLLLAV